jgi:dipeptidyl aminopeptidase/acylaminoacyl peptidase
MRIDMLKSRKLLRLTVSLVLIVTVVLSTMSFTGTVAAAKPWYEDGMRQLTDRGVIASSEASPDAGVKASNFLRMAVLWFTYNHGEDYNTVASELGWIKDGENFADDSFVKRGEAVKICLRALGLDNEEHKSLKQYMETAKKNGIIKGYTDGRLGEEEKATLAQIAVIFDNARKLQYSKLDNKSVERLSVEDFFQNPLTAGYSMSEDGKYLAYAAPWENRLNVFVVPTEGGEPKRVTSTKDRNIAGYAWKDDKIIYLKDNGGDENYHIYTANVDGKSEDVDLTPYAGVRAVYVDLLKGNKNEILISMNKNDPKVFDIYKLNILTGETTIVAKNPGNISGWLTDNNGKVRIAGITDGVETTILYREKEEDEFKPLISAKAGETFEPIMFTKDNSSIYAASNIGRDTAAIVKMDIKSGKQETIYERKDVDVSNLIISPATKEILAAVYVTDKTKVEYFDEDFKALMKKLSDKFDKSLEIGLRDMSDDMTKFILTTGSDKDAGSYYFYDLNTDKLTKLGDFMPWLDSGKMSSMIPISYKSRDGLTIHGYLTIPKGKIPEKLPVVVNPHGGPWARDVWGFNPEVQYLANRGFAVLQINFRGSTGYGKKFVDAGNKQWGLKMQDDITDGVQWLIKIGVADPERIGIYGGSYGGYAALAGITFTPDLYAAAVDYVGVSNIFTLLKTIPPYWESQRKMFNERVGDPEKDKELLEKVSPVFHADKIKAPLFVAQGANDPRVNKAESDQIVEALKKRGINVQYMVKDDEGHGFVNQENRYDFYKAMGDFFDKYLSK